MDLNSTSLSEILLAIIGGGGVVPFLYRLWLRGHPRAADDAKVKAEIESISATAAKESIEAMQGVMVVLREQVTDGHRENAELREEIAVLRRHIVTLAEIVRTLGGTVPDLT